MVSGNTVIVGIMHLMVTSLCSGPTSLMHVLSHTFRDRRGNPLATKQDRVPNSKKRNSWREWPQRYARMSRH